MFFLSESGNQNMWVFFFLSVLNAEFEYFFSSILREAAPSKSCLSRQTKEGVGCSERFEQNNNNNNNIFKRLRLKMLRCLQSIISAFECCNIYAPFMQGAFIFSFK